MFTFLGITLVSLLVPVGLGMFLKSKWPEIAQKVLKVSFSSHLH